MPSLLYSRKPLLLVFLGLLLTGIYITYYFTLEAIAWGTVLVVLMLGYIWLYTSRHINIKDSISAIVLASLFLVIGSTIGFIISRNIGSVFYTLSLLILSLGLVYALTKYTL